MVTEIDRLEQGRGTYYTRGHSFRRESIALERAEHARVHGRDLDHADRLFEFVEHSQYPLHAAMGHLGRAAIAQERGEPTARAQLAVELATRIRARLLVERAEALQRGENAVELFFPC